MAPTPRAAPHSPSLPIRTTLTYRPPPALNPPTPHQHIDEEDNNASTPFDFSVENWEKVHAVLARYPTNYKKSATIPLLDLAQRQNGNHLTLAAMKKVAKILEVPDMAVYEVATFYTMFNRTPVGKYFIQLCGTTPCMVNGAEHISATIQKHLGIGEGETTSDGLFTLREVECLGACCNAPMIQINDDFYENLDEASTIKLLDDCAAGNPPRMTYFGSRPMNGQFSCEGPQGKFSLKETVKPGHGMREFKPKVDPRTVMVEMYGEQDAERVAVETPQ